VSEVELIGRRVFLLLNYIKKKRMSPMETPEIFLVYPWEPPLLNSLDISKYLFGSVPLYASEMELIRRSLL
jgi:hypothetical protein